MTAGAIHRGLPWLLAGCPHEGTPQAELDRIHGRIRTIRVGTSDQLRLMVCIDVQMHHRLDHSALRLEFRSHYFSFESDEVFESYDEPIERGRNGTSLVRRADPTRSDQPAKRPA